MAACAELTERRAGGGSLVTGVVGAQADRSTGVVRPADGTSLNSSPNTARSTCQDAAREA